VKRTVVFYNTADGKCPVRDFLDFLKKSQKTPKYEIEKAESYRRDFLKRRTKT